MLHKIRVAVATTLALAALTGCGKAATDASAGHVYEPLPSLSTATPTESPKPTVEASPSPSPTPSPTPTAEPTTPATGVAGSAGAVVAAPVQDPATAVADVAAPVAAPIAAAPVAAAPVAAPPVAAGPVEMTETVSTTTSSVTTTTLEAKIMIVVTCEGRCGLDDLAAPELTGTDGPISQASIRELFEAEAQRQGGDERKLTEELIETLAKDDWNLLEKGFQDGQEKFVFTSAADRR